jgi:hypothetical protein
MTTGDQMIESVLLAPSTSSTPLVGSAPAGEFAEVFERVQHETASQESSPQDASQDVSLQETAPQRASGHAADAVHPGDASTTQSLTEDTEELDDISSVAVSSVLGAPTPPPPAQTLVAALKALTDPGTASPETAVQPTASSQAVLSATPATAALGDALVADADDVSDLISGTTPVQTPVAEQASATAAPAAVLGQDLELLNSSPSQASGTVLEGETSLAPVAEASEAAAALKTAANAAPALVDLDGTTTEQPLQVPAASANQDPALADAQTSQAQTPASEQVPSAQLTNATPQTNPAQSVSEASPRALQAPMADLVRNEVWEIAKRASLVAPRSIEASVLTEHGSLAITARHAATGVQVTLSGDAAAAVDLPALHLELSGSGIDVSVGTPDQRAEEADTRTFTATAQNPAAVNPRPLSQRSPSSISQLDVLA